MKSKCLWVIAAVFLTSVKSSYEKKIVCYFNSTSIYRPGKGQFNIHNIDPTLCTHLVYSHAGITINGDVKSLNPIVDLPINGGKDGFNQFNKLRLLNDKVKTFIAVGGQDDSSAAYSAVAANPSKRRAFVGNAIKFVKNYGFNGMSFDWQYPNEKIVGPNDKVNYIKLLKLLRTEFDKAGLLLMATVGAVYHLLDKSYDIPEMVKYLDIINLMAFDFHGPWESKTGYSSQLFPAPEDVGINKRLTVNETLNYWLGLGAPAHKLVMGIPSYARRWTLRDPENNEVGAAAKGPGLPGPYTQQPGFLGYNEFVENLPNYFRVYDLRRLSLYAYDDDTGDWFSYEDDWIQKIPPIYKTTIQPKTEVIKNLGLGGAMLYNIDTDDFLGVSGMKFRLLQGINRDLKDYVPPTPPLTQVIDPCDMVCRETGYLRDPKDCALFYFCEPYGTSYLKKQFFCPANLVFDLNLSICNYRYQVNCTGCNL